MTNVPGQRRQVTSNSAPGLSTVRFMPLLLHHCYLNNRHSPLLLPIVFWVLSHLTDNLE
ncbi:hypothetical protein IQ259_25900 [Fortiea sp. LEGE XX443]|uniref:hypothetical protein n=1 Tax=Fortiea sp. LEGE XX443 TaxID=1828611 RepID=UPI001881E232|nr:hypothetical protein [Fortiea sp. LEGE XX443]MBE9008392.1 hypothetical protein [Fortiea sp. LEGE XX443]